MVRFEEDALYSRKELEEFLQEIGIDCDYFISVLRPRKVLRRCWLGRDILDAYRAASSIEERIEASRRRRGDPASPNRRLAAGTKRPRLSEVSGAGVSA